MTKHWIANNLFALAFAIEGISLLHLNNLVIACILCSGLFVYDVLWVFGTDVMLTVAIGLEAPLKLVFPTDVLDNGLKASSFVMIGLGDIVVPGMLIALLLRFDCSRNLNGRPYFHATIVAYVLGMLTTIFIKRTFDHAQPALLYLVPYCMVAPLVVALIKGELNSLFS